MNIIRAASHPTKRGPADYFTGTVWIEEVGGMSDESRARCVRVSFEPGARTAWHTHPHGQTLHILSGVGRVQKAGEPVVEVYPGDTVWFAPGERHWHGATPHSLMVHLATHQTDSTGSSVTWLDHVSDADFNGTGG